jgi:hypothetical protein
VLGSHSARNCFVGSRGLRGFRFDEAQVLEHFNQACAALAAEMDAVALRAAADAQGCHILGSMRSLQVSQVLVHITASLPLRRRREVGRANQCNEFGFCAEYVLRHSND